VANSSVVCIGMICMLLQGPMVYRRSMELFQKVLYQNTSFRFCYTYSSCAFFPRPVVAYIEYAPLQVVHISLNYFYLFIINNVIMCSENLSKIRLRYHPLCYNLIQCIIINVVRKISKFIIIVVGCCCCRR